MGHKIAEAILENGQLKYVDKKLPSGKIKVHIIYDTSEEAISETKILSEDKETSGIYKNIDIEVESKKLRANWGRNVGNWVPYRHKYFNIPY